MRGKLVIGHILGLSLIVIFASAAFAQCPDDKEPVNITTPSGITKTLCIPAAAVQGIENAAEHSGGTIVASNCPCFSTEDIEALVALGEPNCSGRAEYDSDGNMTFESFFCSVIGSDKIKNIASVTFDISTVNRCYYDFNGDKYSGLPPVTVDEVISESEYDTCRSTLISVVSPK